MTTTTALDFLDTRILSFYHEARELRSTGLCRPRFALVYPTYACNHNCVGCDYADYNAMTHPGTLSHAQFDQVLDQLVDFGVRAVEFCGGGEPLLHPHLDASMDRLHRAGINVGLLTNGTLVSPQRAELLVRACSYVRVSVEAGSASVFQVVKRPKSPSASFARVMKNLMRLVRAKERQGTRCQISYKYAINALNRGDVDRAVALAERLRVDSIQFKCTRNVPSELAISEKRELANVLTALRASHPRVRILGDLLPSQESVPCWLSPTHVMVDPLGDLYLCCYYRHRAERHRFGNMLRTPLRELWYSSDHRDALRGILRQECQQYDCRFMKYANVMDAALRDGALDFI